MVTTARTAARRAGARRGLAGRALAGRALVRLALVRLALVRLALVAPAPAAAQGAPAAPPAAAPPSAAPAPAPTPVLVLARARVLDPVRGARPGLAQVVVRGRLIERIDSAGAAAPAGARVVDVGGRWVLPGLIDAHTHIATLAAARRALASGVTTVRSAGTPAFQDVALRDLVRAGALAGPDVVAAGVFVTPDLGETLLADARLAPLAGGVRTPAELRAVVRVNLARGVDVIKTRGTERAGLPDTDPRKQTYTEAQLRAVVEEAATRGVPVEVHAHGDEGARAAVLAGARSIEHGTYLSDSTLRLMRARGTWLVPTYSTVQDLTTPGGDYDDPVLELRGRHMLPRLGETVRRARALGVRVATGADTDYGPGSTTRIAHEVEAFVRLGYPPAEALRAATSDAAALLGVDGRTGRLEPGREADLIVVESNPLDDVRALQDVLLVVSNGRVAVTRLPFALPASQP
jgi:imidazolonepropionase-like amidohydrolase